MVGTLASRAISFPRKKAEQAYTSVRNATTDNSYEHYQLGILKEHEKTARDL